MARAQMSGQTGHKHIYRLATYGNASSGKTCILAALAMARKPHPDGLGCVWVCDAATVTRPPGAEADWKQDDPIVARYRGERKLSDAINLIENKGIVPEPNVPEYPFRYLFDFTLPDGRMRRVEMIDYSGESVDPKKSDQEIAKSLTRHCEEADGILVLAEATANAEQDAKLQNELRKLEQAFMLVADGRRRAKADPIPIALIFPKWDRVSHHEDCGLAERMVELAAFLARAPTPPHVVLSNILRSIAGTDGEISFFRQYPLSAFGRAKIIGTISKDGQERRHEVPASINPLPSYGIEDPFIGLCDQADRLESARLQRSLAEISVWKLWQLAPRRGLLLAQEASLYVRRFPSHFPQAALGRSLAKSAFNRFLEQCTSACVAMVILFLGCIEVGFAVHDGTIFSRYSAEMTKTIDPNDRDAQIAELPTWEAADKFLGDFQSPAWYRWLSHLCHNPAKAQNARQSLEDSMTAARAWSTDKQTTMDTLNNMPSLIMQTTDPTKLAPIVAPLANFQPQYSDVKILEERVKAAADKRNAELTQDAEDGKFLSQIQGFMDSRDIKAAANNIEHYSGGFHPSVAAIEAAKRLFRKDAPMKLYGIIEDTVFNAHQQDWDLCRDRLQEIAGNQALDDIYPGDHLMKEEIAACLVLVERHRVETAYDKWKRAVDAQRPAPEIVALGADLKGTDRAGEVGRYAGFKNELSTPKSWTLKLNSITLVHDFHQHWRLSFSILIRCNGISLGESKQLTYPGKSMLLNEVINNRIDDIAPDGDVEIALDVLDHDSNSSGHWIGRQSFHVKDLCTDNGVEVDVKHLPGDGTFHLATPDDSGTVQLLFDKKPFPVLQPPLSFPNCPDRKAFKDILGITEDVTSGTGTK